MTSASILPSVGPPPPNIRRPNVPEELKPKIANPADDLAAGKRRSSRSREEAPPPKVPERPSGPENERAAAVTNSAVAVQVLEGQIPPSARDAEPTEASEPVELTRVEDLAPSPEPTKLVGELSPEDEAYVRELQARDREVRAHEAAHATAGSGYTGTPNYEYVTGPDGVRYAVGGHVDIDTSKVPDDPEATIQKMEVVRSAALAPARPSGQDRAVAAAAEQAIREAQAELREQRAEEAEELSGGDEQGLDPLAPEAGASIAPGNTPENTPENINGFVAAGSEPVTLQPQLISVNLIA